MLNQLCVIALVIEHIDKRPDDRIPRLGWGDLAVLMLEQVLNIPEYRQIRHPGDHVPKAQMKRTTAGGCEKSPVEILPREVHATPALRPGVARLLVARSGRRASLRFQGVG